MHVAKQIGRVAISEDEREFRRTRVRAVRDGLGITQTEMADKCELSRTAYNKIETGRDVVTGVESLRGLARGWGISMDDAFAYLEGVIELGDITRRRASHEAQSATTRPRLIASAKDAAESIKVTTTGGGRLSGKPAVEAKRRRR